MSASGWSRWRSRWSAARPRRPELLFLDEPTAGFDPQARRQFHALVRRLAETEETTILLTTHDLDEAEKLADRVLVLAAGRIVADDTVDGLSRRLEAETQVRWTASGVHHSESVRDATAFVRALFEELGSTITGSTPHVPTFWVLGTKAPMIIPIGMVASRPNWSTHAIVSQPDGSVIRLSNSRKLGTRITAMCGSSDSD